VSLLPQQQITVPQTIDAYHSENKYFIKTFLVNDQLNQLGWKLNPDHIEANIKKFIGRPLVLTPYKNHPHEFKHYKQTGDITKDKEEFLKLQERWKIGTIIDITGSGKLQQGTVTNEYTAVVEVDNENAIRAFKEGKVPKYVSPSILRTNGTWEDIKDFEALHLAIVDNPAFGVEVANIRRPCEGAKSECLNMLAQGGEIPTTECPYEILNTVNNVFQAGILFKDEVKTLVPKLSANDITSVKLEDNSNVQVTETAKPEQVNQEQNVIDNKIQEQKIETTPIGTPKVKASVPDLLPNSSNPPGSEEQREEVEQEEEKSCEKAAREYGEKILELEAEIKASKEFRENYAKEQKQNKVQAKRSKIENVIPKDYADSEEERNKAIQSLEKLADAELDIVLEKFVVPATSKNKAAPRKHTEFLKNEVPNNNTNVAQASANNTRKTMKLKELNRIFSFSGIVPNKNKGVSS
jgi:hypothetical protein